MSYNAHKDKALSHRIVWLCAIVTLLCLLPAHGRAQHPWNPATLTEACSDDVYLVEPSGDIKASVDRSAIDAESAGGMLSIGIRRATLEYNASYHVSGPYLYWGKRYVGLRSGDLQVLIPEAVAEQLLPHMVSHSYWRLRYSRLQQWNFVAMENLGGLLNVDTTDRRYDRYSTLFWLGFSFQPSEEVPVVFSVLTNTHEPQTLSLRAVERLAEWGSFASAAQQQAYERQQLTLKESALQQQRQLQAELDSLSAIGFIVEQQADSIHQAMQGDSLALVQEHMRAEVERTKERMNADEIFILNLKPARSDYMFGLEFNFYNCFEKTISKVEITVVPVNDRDQVQPDKFNRTTRSVRCMGPIRPGSPAQYVFDELFWNDKGRIKFMRVTNITFHFTDGTRRAFNGYQTILKHSLK